MTELERIEALEKDPYALTRRDQIMGKSACELVYLLRSTAEGRELIRKKMEEMAARKQAATN